MYYLIYFLLITMIKCNISPKYVQYKLGEITTEANIREDGPTHPMDNPNWIPPVGPSEELQKEYWLTSGQNLLHEQLKKNELNQNIAKNIIIFIGDGMSIATQSASRVYLGGEEMELSFEKFPYVGLTKTYCVNYQVSDSACTANAFFSGVKTNYGTLGVSASVPLANCTAQQDQEHHLDSILKYAQDAGKSTGIVTTSRLTHATPAAAYAVSADREWEYNAVTPEGCVDIALQLVYGNVAEKIKVLLGGGTRELTPTTTLDILGRAGFRTDNRNLIEEWIIERQKIGEAIYVNDRDSLLNVNPDSVDYLLGTFGHGHMNYNLDANHTIQPTLAEMVDVALSVLSKNDEGYVLIVESALIDGAHHATRAQYALDETIQLHLAVEHAKQHINEDNTLLIVTADHSHTMSIGGYPIRGNNILSTGDFSRDDAMPFFTLNYANGMGYYYHVNNENGGREDPIGMDYMNTEFRFPATVPLEDETHAGDDVAVFAQGPWAHLFTGCYEQNFIAHGMLWASCLGENIGGFCSNGNSLKIINKFIVFIVLIQLSKYMF